MRIARVLVVHDGSAECADDAAVLAEVDRFAVRCIEPRASRPELPMTASSMDEVLAEARALGLVPGDEPGLGLWEDAAHGPRRSLHTLERLARANASVALALHVESSASIVARWLGLAVEGPGVLALEGRFGVGRASLARLLLGAPLDVDDRATLGDVYGLASARLLTASASFAWALSPSFVEGDDRIVWRRLDRASIDVQRHANAHGFDELATMSIAPSTEWVHAPAAHEGESSGPDVLARALAIHALGLVAIALGTADRAHAAARTYAASRRQGGALIDRHAAVALLLASSRGALESVGRGLESLGRQPIEPARLASILALRAEAHPLLGRGANDALQVFGGMGYMRDVGQEKIVRELNHLRVVAGSPTELALVVAEWERLHG